MPKVNKKNTSEKANFCPYTTFSLYLKSRLEKVHAAKQLIFCTSCFGVTKIIASIWRQTSWKDNFNLTSKFMKVWTDLKKKTAPQYNSIALNCKTKLADCQKIAAIAS